MTVHSSVNDGRRVVRLRGELDVESAPRAAEALRGKVNELELVTLDFMDSTGISLLVALAERNESLTKLRVASGQVERLIALTGIAALFDTD